jgi:hypothetical protein
MAMISGRDEQLEPKVQILLPKVFPESIMRLGSVVPGASKARAGRQDGEEFL